MVGHNQNTCENEGNLQTFVDHNKNPSSDNTGKQLIEEKWESNWESDTEDGLKSSDESIENNSEEDQEGYEWDSDSHSSEDPTNNLVTYGRYIYNYIYAQCFFVSKK